MNRTAKLTRPTARIRESEPTTRGMSRRRAGCSTGGSRSGKTAAATTHASRPTPPKNTPPMRLPITTGTL